MTYINISKSEELLTRGGGVSTRGGVSTMISPDILFRRPSSADGMEPRRANANVLCRVGSLLSSVFFIPRQMVACLFHILFSLGVGDGYLSRYAIHFV